MRLEYQLEVILLSQRLSLIGADNKRSRGPGVGEHTVAGADSDGADVVGDGLAGPRIDRVGINPAIVLPHVPVVAGGRERRVLELDLASDLAATVQWPLDRDTPFFGHRAFVHGP